VDFPTFELPIVLFHRLRVHCIVNEQNNKSIAELWDGCNLRCTFRGCVYIRLHSLWEELLRIASTICLTDREDEMVWQFQSSEFILLIPCIE
jgi:hypothetical protein